MAPPNLIQLVSLVDLPVFLLLLLVNLLIIWDWIACKLLTLFLYSSMRVIITCMCFFSIIPPFEELQDPDSSPRREEVGRRALGDYGGFLPPFFYRASFTLVNDRNLAR